MTAAEVRRKCRSIGERRARHSIRQQKLDEDTRTVLAEAQGVISVGEAASLAGLSRSTAYQVYLAK